MARWTSHADRVLLTTAILIASVTPALAAEERPVSFNRDVRPILSDLCFSCHGPDAEDREADLRLDVEDSAKADLGGYRVITSGEPESSELMARVTSTDEADRMPPADSGKKLSAEQVAILQQWIQQGAPWSRHWAYVPPSRHAVPRVRDTDWPINWIDNFILARLEAEGLEPSPDAHRVNLIRRLSFDLTGLPPTPAEVDRFVRDKGPDAYQRLVDRLLATDAYGERMTMFWLDLVRYADTVGYHGDQDHNISPYRDYVIDAFNDNVPFDRFTEEQLAGDLLTDATVDQRIASGYNRLLQTSHEGGVQPKEYLAIYAADRVRNFSAVWMGATLGCAQCHDHKYDPYTMKDFYCVTAFFADLDEAQHFGKGTNSLPTARPPEIEVLSKRERERLADLESRVTQLKTRFSRLSSDDASQAESLQERLEDLRQKIETIRGSARKTMISVAIQPRTTRILARGNWLDETGEIVQPAVPEFLGRLPVSSRRATRLDLARWLTDANDGVGGLTARVQANRLWYLVFGSGLAQGLDDFGGQGIPPDHPELLDNLAVEFVRSRWDVKQIMRLLVVSRAYRQSSLVPSALGQRDPYNRLVARQSRFRLPAEMVRDNVLAISGLLVRDYGGGSVKPYQPAGHYRHLNFPTREYQHHTDQRQWRRGVYVHWQRQFLHPMLKAFDAPSREECTAGRSRSNTPTAALTLLNDPTFVEAARVFAERIIRAGDETDTRLDFAFRQAVSRSPDPWEREALGRLLAASESRYRADRQSAGEVVKTGLAAAATDLDVVQLATWTAAARAILNLNETITRN